MIFAGVCRAAGFLISPEAWSALPAIAIRIMKASRAPEISACVRRLNIVVPLVNSAAKNSAACHDYFSFCFTC
jgi:hypothetical protein